MPAELDPAEGKLDPASGSVVVDEHLPGFEAVRHAQLATAILGPDSGNESERRAVGQCDRLIFTLEGQDRQHGSEQLLLRDRVVGWDAAEQAGGDVISSGRRIVHNPAFGNELNAVCAGLVEVAHQPGLLLRTDQRAAVEVLQGGSGLECPEAFGDTLRQRLADGAFHQHTAPCRAGLSGVLDRGVDEEGKRFLKIRIRKNHLRGFAAEFQRDRNRPLGGGALHESAHFRRAGERVVLNVWMVQEGVSGFLPKSRNDVQGTRREAHFHRQLPQIERSLRGFLSGLEDTGIAHRQCPANGASDDLHRIVPRDDMARDPMRFAHGQDRVTLQIRDRFAVNLVRRTAVEFKVAGAGAGIHPRLLERLAHVAGFEFGKLILVLADELSEIGEQPSALHGGQAAPFTVQCGLRRFHSTMNIEGIAAGDVVKDFPRAGVNHRQGFSGVRSLPLVGDEDFS